MYSGPVPQQPLMRWAPLPGPGERLGEVLLGVRPADYADHVHGHLRAGVLALPRRSRYAARAASPGLAAGGLPDVILQAPS
jgi:hypothetical protein